MRVKIGMKLWKWGGDKFMRTQTVYFTVLFSNGECITDTKVINDKNTKDEQFHQIIQTIVTLPASAVEK